MTETSSTIRDAQNAVQSKLEAARVAAREELLTEVAQLAERLAGELAKQIRPDNSLAYLGLSTMVWREGELDALRKMLGPDVRLTEVEFHSGQGALGMWKIDKKQWFVHTGSSWRFGLFSMFNEDLLRRQTPFA